MADNILVVIAQASKDQGKQFKCGEIPIGTFIEGSAIKTVFESDKRSDVETFVGRNYGGFTRSAVLTSIDPNILAIFSR